MLDEMVMNGAIIEVRPRCAAAPPKAMQLTARCVFDNLIHPQTNKNNILAPIHLLDKASGL